MSCYVNTVKGPVSPGELGITLMHEHLAELNNSMKRCYADWFHADIFLEKIKPVFQKAKKYGLSTYVDQTAVNMGRDIRFIKLVSLKLPDTVTRIGTRAFAYCTNLASINYPLHLESAGDGYNGGFLFDGTRISSITVVLHPLHGQTLFLHARSTPYDGILPRRRTFFSTFLAVLLLLCRK